MTSRAFITYGRPLKMVTSFKYLGRVISAADDDWPEVVQNLLKARMEWHRMSRILIMEGEILQVYNRRCYSVHILGRFPPAWSRS